MRLFGGICAAVAAYMVVMALGFASAVGGGGAVQTGAFPVGTDLGLSPEQVRNATISLTVSDELRAPPLAVLSMLVAALGESNLLVVPNSGGSGYCGVYQADPRNIACGDTEQQARSFQKGGLGFNYGGAIHLATTRTTASPGEIATLVEGSGQPGSFYDAHRAQAERIAAAWRSGAVGGPLPAGSDVGAVDGEWLALVPGTQELCDRRIVDDVVMLVHLYHLQVTACYAASGHAAGGEHPLGLAIDAVPAPPYSWGVVDRMVAYLGWRAACASTGCAGQTGTAMRFIGWDGYPGHGRGNHVHLSWQHGPGRPAVTVRVLVN